MGNTPKLRFEGFTDAWEQRKLSDLAIFNPKAELPDIFEYVDLESVVGTEMLSHRTESKRTAPSRAQRLAQTGDLFYQTVRPYQKNNYLFEKPDKHYVFSTGYAQMRPVVDGRFLLCLVQNDGFVKVVLDNCTGTSYPAINSNDLAEIEVYSPGNPQEQKQIGDFFKEIDTLITLHQRKCDALAKAKTFYLQNLFPQEGEKEPKLRLEGFTDSWNQYSLGDLYTERNERGNEMLQILTVSIHTGVSDGAMDEDELGKSVRRSEDKTLYKHVYVGDLIFNMMRAWQGAIGVAKSEGMISPAYISAIPDERVYPPFMNYLLRRKEIISQINNLSYGVTDFRKRLYWDSFIKVKCRLPSVAEQKRITDVFEQLDTLITRQEHRIKALKTMKKFMLQNMFPQEG